MREFQANFADLIEINGYTSIFIYAMESIEANIDWSNKRLDNVKKWLEERFNFRTYN